MNPERAAAVVCQAASILLQYPDETFRERIPLVTKAAATLPPGPARTALTGLVDHLAATPPREAAEHYVATFDRRRRCCLYLTWWTDGETRRRGQALATLKSRYRRAGLEPGHPRTARLPAASPRICRHRRTGRRPRPAPGTPRRNRTPPAGPARRRLAVHGCSGGGVHLLPGPSPQDRAAAQRLARTGPPAETVGLEPYSATPGGGLR